MTESTGTIVRPFDGSLADAQGLLTVERATFDEAPYSAEQVQAMLTDSPRRAWLAIGGGQVAGFVVAFATHGLRGPSWEIDLLAVHPNWTGRGLATRLIRAAATGAVGAARQARAVVATDNSASMRAFARAGFRPTPGVCNLLIYRTEGLDPQPWSIPGVTVQEAETIEEAANWLPEDAVLDGSRTPEGSEGLTLLLAEQDGRPVGYAELIEVQTLLYCGLWIESLVASTRPIHKALAREAANRAKAAGLDEIGAMVPRSNWPWQQALLAEGFRSLGDFHWFTALLPLSGPTSSLRSGGTTEEQPGGSHA